MHYDVQPGPLELGKAALDPIIKTNDIHPEGAILPVELAMIKGNLAHQSI